MYDKTLLSTSLALCLSVGSHANALTQHTGPFMLEKLPGGYELVADAAEHDSVTTHKAPKKSPKEGKPGKAKDAKCGEAKCGGNGKS